MQIKHPIDVVTAIEQARISQGLSARALSLQAGKSHPAYYWWRKKASSTKFEFETAFEYATALGLGFSITGIPEDTDV